MYSLNKLDSYSRISALGPVGHRTSHFKRAVCISCRPRVDVHKGGGGSGPCGQGEGIKNSIFCGRHKWMTTYCTFFTDRPFPWMINASDFDLEHVICHLSVICRPVLESGSPPYRSPTKRSAREYAGALCLASQDSSVNTVQL